MIKKIERDECRPSVQIAELLATHLQTPEAEQKDFIRRAREEFEATLISSEEAALELLSLVSHHPSSYYEIQKKIRTRSAVLERAADLDFYIKITFTSQSE